MEALHGLTAATLAEMIQPTKRIIPAVRNEEGEITEPEREEWVYPQPAALAVARAFLKDNSIFATDAQSAAVGDLKASLASRKGKRVITAQDEKDALGVLGRELLQ